MNNLIHLSDGSSYQAELVVYKDFVGESARQAWRLFWLNPGTSSGVNVDSHVTGQPFFKRMRDAIASGEKRFGITAKKVVF